MDDVLIVGGGAIGLSIAYQLATEGLAVHVIDRGNPGSEASWAGAGILPPAGPKSATPIEMLARLSYELHPQWAAQLLEETGIDTGYHPSGGLYVARDEAGSFHLRLAQHLWESSGVRYEPLAPDAIQNAEPQLSVGRTERQVREAIRLPDEAQLRNPRHLKALIAACHKRGVTISAGAAADGFETDGDRVTGVVTSSGTVRAGAIVLAGGAWTSAIALQLGLRVQVRPIRGQIVLLRTGQPILRHVINEGPRYLVPREDGRVLVGSTEEDVGFDKLTTSVAKADLLELATSLVPALAQAEVERTWAGLRPATIDGLPYLGPLAGWRNAFIAAGHFRQGLYLSPGTALVLADCVLGRQPRVPLAEFASDRHRQRVEAAL
jgi:glycine oxidase